MNLSALLKFSLMAIATGCAASDADAAGKTLRIGAMTLTMQAPVKCVQAHRPRRELARYLVQYDPSGDPKEDIRDETPWTKEEIEVIKNGLVGDGFHYPGSQDSVITWMDFDGDGICDFTASAGFGGMHAIDHWFLFRGLPKRDFQLADADHTYMESSSVLVPYVPIAVAGERLPILAKKNTLMQWQEDRKQFATCETVSYGPKPVKQGSAVTLLTALCPHQQQIYTWAADLLPHKNELPYPNAE